MAESPSRALSPDQARSVYNRIGRFQDWQGFYESASIADMVDHAAFGDAGAVFELGCGTGALAEELLSEHLSPTARYLAVDVSDRMVELSTRRLAPWVDRCEVRLVDGSLPLPGVDGGFDRFVSVYVFDLLGSEYTRRVLAEAERLLGAGGLLCTVTLTEGVSAVSRAVCRTWDWVWERTPALVGGCRPVDLTPALEHRWDIVHRSVQVAWGVPSEVIVATPKVSAGPA